MGRWAKRERHAIQRAEAARSATALTMRLPRSVGVTEVTVATVEGLLVAFAPARRSHAPCKKMVDADVINRPH